MDVAMPPVDQEALLRSADPVLEANKRLVHAMWREIVQGGQVSRIPHYISEDYIQHNPNIGHGRRAFTDFIASSRPEREVSDRILFPLVTIMAEGDKVLVVNARPYPEPDGTGTYTTGWFDLFRIRDGMIVEHWDAALKEADAHRKDPNDNR